MEKGVGQCDIHTQNSNQQNRCVCECARDGEKESERERHTHRETEIEFDERHSRKTLKPRKKKVEFSNKTSVKHTNRGILFSVVVLLFFFSMIFVFVYTMASGFVSFNIFRLSIYNNILKVFVFSWFILRILFHCVFRNKCVCLFFSLSQSLSLPFSKTNSVCVCVSLSLVFNVKIKKKYRLSNTISTACCASLKCEWMYTHSTHEAYVEGYGQISHKVDMCSDRLLKNYIFYGFGWYVVCLVKFCVAFFFFFFSFFHSFCPLLSHWLYDDTHWF